MSNLVIDKMNMRIEKWVGDKEDIGLIVSVKEKGIHNPLWVREISDEVYGIIAGNRRFHAAREGGLEKVPVFNFGSISDKEALELSILENVPRRQAPIYDKIKAVCTIAKQIQSSNKYDVKGIILTPQLMNKLHEITAISPQTISKYLQVGFYCPEWFLNLLRPSELRDDVYKDEILFWFKQEQVNKKITLNNAWLFSKFFIDDKIPQKSQKLEYFIRNFAFSQSKVLESMLQKVLTNPKMSVIELQQSYEMDKYGFYSLNFPISPIELQRLRFMALRRQKKLSYLIRNWVLSRLEKEEELISKPGYKPPIHTPSFDDFNVVKVTKKGLLDAGYRFLKKVDTTEVYQKSVGGGSGFFRANLIEKNKARLELTSGDYDDPDELLASEKVRIESLRAR